MVLKLKCLVSRFILVKNEVGFVYPMVKIRGLQVVPQADRVLIRLEELPEV